MKIDFSFYSDQPVWLKTSLIIGIVVSVIVGFFAIARYTDKDDGLCRSCHPTIHELWHSSQSHPAAKVTCYECHTKPLGAFPESGSNPIVHYRDKIIPVHYNSGRSVLNENCLRCHSEIPKLQEVKSTRIVKISHAKHYKAEKVKIDDCMVCHYAVAHDKYAIATNRPRMQGCFLGECHQADTKADRCELCHFVKLVEKEKVLEKIEEK
ncbi:MAG TPA: hypothetical protein ENN66_06075 [Proteobacteria bacterium]|nr:hypothetical protein [Pseudomonadota bacterium]